MLFFTGLEIVGLKFSLFNLTFFVCTLLLKVLSLVLLPMLRDLLFGVERIPDPDGQLINLKGTDELTLFLIVEGFEFLLR
jgi:hypothetical protein